MMKLTEEDIYWATLQSLPSIGGTIIRKLVAFYGSIDKIWENLVDKKLPPRESGICDKTTEQVVLKTDLQALAKILKINLEKREVGILSFEGNGFPPQLGEIYNPPAVLFYKGDISSLTKLEKPVAIVGARNCTPYGKNVTAFFAEELAKNKVTIISGGARGVDSSAHNGALKGHGRTIVVLGCGLDITYPPENKKLYQEVIERGGVLISEYSLGVKPIGSNFPARNRIIAGLAKAVIVVEAKAKSGSLITADMAINEGRDVYTIPGNILTSANDGCHWLIRQGAGVLTRPKDILEIYGWQENYVTLEKDVRQKPNSMIVFTSEEEQVINTLVTDKSLSLEEIMVKSKLPLHIVQRILLNFELKHIVEKINNHGYILKYSRSD